MTSTSQVLLEWLIWLIPTFISIGILITASALLLRERHVAVWLMLTGSVIFMVGQIVRDVQFFVLITANGSLEKKSTFAANGAICLGMLLFSIGLLLHALYRRGLAGRILELETILASRNKDDLKTGLHHSQ